MPTVSEARLVALERVPFVLPEQRAIDRCNLRTDSATSVLRRIEFRLTSTTPDEAPRRLEGYTTFSAISPFITLPDSSVAYWWRSTPAPEEDWGRPDVLQLIRVMSIEYTGARPPP